VKDRLTAGLLAILLGPLGMHRFYLGEPGQGCMFALASFVSFLFGLPFLLLGVPFFGLGIIWLIGLAEGLSLLTMPQEQFDRRYNSADFGGITSTTRRKVSVRRVVVDADGQRHEMYEEHISEPDFAVPNAMREAPQARSRTHTESEYRTRRPRNNEERDRFVLQAAFDHRGRLAPADLALVSHFSLAEAKAALDALTAQRVCELESEAEGMSTYVFPEFIDEASPHERMSGRSAADEDLHAT
jgi:TM2 domain-containing membrane protein YozV